MPTITIAPHGASGPSEDEGLVTKVDTASAPESSFERYERKRVLGQGGMGTVVLVTDRAIRRNVALKQLNEDATDEDAIARFEREAKVQGQLEHPAIVPVYDIGKGPDGKAFFTMKRVRGQSLADVLDLIASGQPTPFSRRKLLSAFSQLCAAAHYAHERGVVHRDIKPTNVMLGSYGEVYLLDWGVARVAGEPTPRQPSEEHIDAKAGVHTGYGSVMGTLTTMAPEQAVGGEVDARTDVYALGAVLFHILTGEPLHPTGEVDEVIAKITKGVEARPSIRVPGADVPPELEALCVAATRLHPADRLPSAMALRDAIEAYLDGDRDLELRRDNAIVHARAAAKAAEEALAADGPSHEQARSEALRDVGKALALDPSNKDALATLVRLLTTPPKVMPKEIAAEHDADTRRNIRRGGIAASIVYGYISLNAISTWILGVHDMQIFLTSHTLWLIALALAIATILRPSYPMLFATFLLGIGTSTFITSVYGPYILVATLITMHAVLYSFVRDWKPRVAIIVTSCVAWTISVAGEAMGLFPDTIRFVGGDMLIHSTVIDFPTPGTTIYLYASTLATIVGPTLIIGALRSAYNRSEIAMRLQSWQLRQLVSETPRQGDTRAS